MYPNRQRKKPGRPRGTRRYANPENWRVMKWFDAEREARDLTLGDIAERLGYRSASRVSEYFRQKIVAGPDMVRQLALAVGVSPIEAQWRAGHYGAVLDYLMKLYQLGWAWMRTDGVDLPDRGMPFAGCYLRRDGKLNANVNPNEPPGEIAHRYHCVRIYNDTGVFKSLSIAKPIAYAILLGVGLFPRRGDKLRPDAPRFITELSTLAGIMLPTAERAARAANIREETLKALRQPLSKAEDIMPWQFYGVMRLAVVAEYVHAWCGFASTEYANYARLALYEQGAFVGEPRGDEDIWKWQRTDIPQIDELRVDALTVT